MQKWLVGWMMVEVSRGYENVGWGLLIKSWVMIESLSSYSRIYFCIYIHVAIRIGYNVS